MTTQKTEVDQLPEEFQVLRYETPVTERSKITTRMGDTDILTAFIQVVKEGGENALHTHTAQDAFWLVLSGRIRFYGEGDVVLAELGRHEAMIIKRGARYWFESASDEPLEVLRVAAIDRDLKNERVAFGPRRADFHA
jgi:mannose-6-phosphate isomerase-like protein (cupin superfamily)